MKMGIGLIGLGCIAVAVAISFLSINSLVDGTYTLYSALMYDIISFVFLFFGIASVAEAIKE